MILHGYWRSGTSYRTRIALNLKGLSYEQAGVDLRTGAQKSEAYLSMNPQGLVPALETDGAVLTQSPAILEWLEEAHPEPPLLPTDAVARSQVRAMAALVACDIHPLNNLRVLKALRETFGADQDAVDAWAGRWIIAGFEALEALIARHGEGWCFGDAPTLADCCLIPQVYSARRFSTPLDAFPRILAIAEKAAAHPAFEAAHPDRQPDADPS
ncbi:maleylacetoacetate isomerase [Brevundimonas sp. BAL450]|jgi:maleylpyruvate isomerase|uniref:Maleylacetoacetate isomerase / glutathione S-transferase, zeta n=1 Tax=Brevundimonas abyssalis TAR-001 TaxID=1391729 RepID=A0A8E0KJH7_9CAUL|nr:MULTISPECIES: maleylacetoacetate isomerase [Brevundimonas]MBG7616408.1 maleylacetoacetate isomerase [Brevundimonas sp. BAL450]GAD58370.1 maleylacetoacetate isomerase / glutathione S-transferase, zeta [Brevundimonas abyssalis TAR-001]